MTAQTSTVVDTLGETETARLRDLEGVIGAGLRTFEDTGAALAEIRDDRLYRASHSTFDSYLTERWGFTRQHAGRLIVAAEVAGQLEPIGLQPENERQARELREAGRIVSALEPEQQITVAKFLQASSGSEKPSTSQIKAVAEVVVAIDAHGTVQHPDNGEDVPFTDLTEGQRMAVVRENVTNSAYERVQRQQSHIKEKKLEADKTGRSGWADWVMTYAQQSLTETQELRIVVKRDESGNAKATCLIVDSETHATVAYGDAATYLKKAVMNLVEEVKGV